MEQHDRYTWRLETTAWKWAHCYGSDSIGKFSSFLTWMQKLDVCLQWQSQQQHLEDEVCRLEKEVTSLEEAKRDLDNKQVASDQTLQSHNAVIADLRLQLDNINMEKVGSGMYCVGIRIWFILVTSSSLGE